MSKFEQLLNEYGKAEFDHGQYDYGDYAQDVQDARKPLIERDKKLLDALKRIASGVDVDHSARIAVDVLKDIEEEI